MIEFSYVIVFLIQVLEEIKCEASHASFHSFVTTFLNTIGKEHKYLTVYLSYDYFSKHIFGVKMSRFAIIHMYASL